MTTGADITRSLTGEDLDGLTEDLKDLTEDLKDLAESKELRNLLDKLRPADRGGG